PAARTHRARAAGFRYGRPAASSSVGWGTRVGLSTRDGFLPVTPLVRGLAGEQLRAYLDRLHRSGDAGLQDQAEYQQGDTEPEPVVAAEQHYAGPGDHVRRRAQDGAKGAADGGR